MKRIYLDHHSTTPVDERVLRAMEPYFMQKFGNAASRQHVFGWESEEAVEVARRQVAEFIGAESKEIVFTSGATESNNLALKGAAEAYLQKGNHIITNGAEHSCVLDACRHLEKIGMHVTYVPVQSDGTVDPDAVRRAITPKTILISIMTANNEVGAISAVTEIGAIAREHQVLFHSDIAQAAGKIWVDVEEMNVDIASLSGHKFYAPKGVGALFVKRRNPRVKLIAQMDGGGHEDGNRSGTLNVPGIVGLGKAAEICCREFEKDFSHYSLLRNALYAKIYDRLDGCILNGPEIDRGMEEPRSRSIRRLPNNLNLTFEGVDAEAIMMAMKEVAVSSGSACTTALREPSHVLKAMGVSDDRIKSSLRFGIGRMNAMEEIDYTADRIIDVVSKLRKSRSVSTVHPVIN